MVFRVGWTSAALALLLAASLTAKFAVGYEHGPNDEQRLAAGLQRRLIASGFATAIDRRPGIHVVYARRGRCRLIVRDGDRWPMMSIVFQQRARPYGPLQYVYRGSASTMPPRIRPTFDRALRHILRAIGIDIERQALVAVAANPSCGAVGQLFDGISVSRQADTGSNGGR